MESQRTTLAANKARESIQERAATKPLNPDAATYVPVSASLLELPSAVAQTNVELEAAEDIEYNAPEATATTPEQLDDEYNAPEATAITPEQLEDEQAPAANKHEADESGQCHSSCVLPWH